MAMPKSCCGSRNGPAPAISRRQAIAGAGSALALWRARAAAAADLPLVRVSIVPIFVVAPHIAAERFGYFTAEGI
jgi:ABC-type nitrate/sulfonate/bicarbonate transport system substrate-binding protein